MAIRDLFSVHGTMQAETQGLARPVCLSHASTLARHASYSERYSLVRVGARLGIFGRVAEDRIFRDVVGNMVLNGAMGGGTNR